MPFTYNPGIEYRGDQSLMQGFKALGEGLKQMGEEQKARAKESSSLQGLLDVYDPEGRAAHRTMSLDEKRAKASAINVRQLKDKLDREMATEGLQQESLRAGLKSRELQDTVARDSIMANEGMTAFNDILRQQIAAEMNGPTPQVPNMERAFQSAMAQMPPTAMNSPAFAQNLRGLKEMLQPDGASGVMTPQPWEDPVTGTRLGIVGKTAMPLGVNPDKVKSEAIPQMDENGNVIGHSIPNGKGGYVFKTLRPEITGELKPAMVGGQIIPGVYVDAAGKSLDLRAGMDKMTDTAIPGGPAAAAKPKVAPAESPLPLPENPTPEKLKKGQLYQTKRGPATWNGTAFEQ